MDPEIIPPDAQSTDISAKQKNGRPRSGNKKIKVGNNRRGFEIAKGRSTLDTAYNRFFEMVDMDELKQALALSSDDKRYQNFLGLLCHPKRQHISATALAAQCRISLPELADFWRKSRTAKATMVMLDNLPKVAQDIAVDAQSSDVTCQRCDGYGQDIDSRSKEDDEGNLPLRICPDCQGLGKVRKVGDTDARKIMLEATGMINKKAPTVAIQQNFGGVGLGSAHQTFDLLDKD